LCLFGASSISRLSAQTVIGAPSPDPSAMLDVQSMTKGFLPPRMTTEARTAIQNPATGLLIFNTTLGCVEMNAGAPSQPLWVCLGVICTVSAASATPTLNLNSALTPITHRTAGATGIGTPTGLPAGVTAAWASNTITISGTPSVAGAYNYQIPLTGDCAGVTATGTITVNDCGAYVSAGVWKAFKCHNLGADESADPFTPSWKLTGNYYQWGRSTVAAGAPTGSGTTEANAGVVVGWNTTAAVNGDWDDVTKTANDPCPEGFRVPTKSNWDAVLNTSLNAARSYPGTSWAASNTNYSSGMRIGTGNTGLFLPAVGFRVNDDGSVFNRGAEGYYLSSGVNGVNAWCLLFSSSEAFSHIDSRIRGMAVRCIAQ